MAKESDQKAQGVEFTSDVYLTAALERAGALQKLYDDGEYSLALYVSGVAVECMFRSYRTEIESPFSARHDLYALAKEARFAERVPERLKEKYAADLGAIVTRWNNAHRYRSEQATLKYLNRAGLYRGIKGDVLKENTRKAVNAAIDIVQLGARRWKS